MLTREQVDDWRSDWLLNYGKPEDETDRQNVREMNAIFDLALQALGAAEEPDVILQCPMCDVEWMQTHASLKRSPVARPAPILDAPLRESAHEQPMEYTLYDTQVAYQNGRRAGYIACREEAAKVCNDRITLRTGEEGWDHPGSANWTRIHEAKRCRDSIISLDPDAKRPT